MSNQNYGMHSPILFKTSKRSRISLSERGRYDVWSRTQSDTFRWKVAEVLGERCGYDVDHSIDPYHFLNTIPSTSWVSERVDQQFALEQLRALFSKDEDLQSPIDKELVAFSAFQEAELSCKFINDAISSGELTVNNRDAACILFYAQRKIAQVLGDAPKISELQPSFGPGAAVTCRKKTSARFKLSTPPSISNSSLGIIDEMSEGVARWCDLHRTIKVVPGSLEFVAKNFKTNRAIVIGPSLTGMYQRSVGSLMKQRLLIHGIDLFSGQEKQRERARLASLTGGDATIDLKAASDSVAYRLVLELLPIDWFELLDSLRDDRVTYQGETILLEKFSSMGNGYTFELESLIFYSLVYGISQHFNIPFHRSTCGVYGDDIIVPTDLAYKVIEYFPVFGFTVNKEKSFLTGPFRESCGGDFALGVDVRPFFIRHRMTHHILVCFYNHMMKKPHQDPDRKIRDLILQYLPPQFQNFGPEGYGDGHLISGADLLSYAKPFKRDFGYSGYTFDTYVEVPLRDTSPMIGDCLLPAYSISLKHEFRSPAVRWACSCLRGYLRDAFIRQVLLDEGTPLDHFVLRKSSDARVKARKIRVYVLGA